MANLSPRSLAKNPKSLALAVIATCLLSMGVASITASAETKAEPKPISYSGVTVAPAIQKLTLTPGQATAPFNVVVTNNTLEPVDLLLSSVDFKSLNESGGLAFIDSDAGSVSHKYGLASWLNLGVPTLHLEPKQSQLIPMSIENRQDLSPGGHYAAVLFRSDKPNTNSGATHVAINQVVSMLVFVQKLGGEKFAVTMKPLSFAIRLFSLPSSLDLSFRNTGNIQATPNGLVTITDPAGRSVSQGQINPESSLVLPDSQRVFKTPMIKVSTALLPGIYTVKTTYHAENGSSTGVSSSKILYINIAAIAIASALILLFGIVVRKATILLRSRRQNKKA